MFPRGKQARASLYDVTNCVGQTIDGVCLEPLFLETRPWLLQPHCVPFQQAQGFPLTPSLRILRSCKLVYTCVCVRLRERNSHWHTVYTYISSIWATSSKSKELIRNSVTNCYKRCPRHEADLISLLNLAREIHNLFYCLEILINSREDELYE